MGVVCRGAAIVALLLLSTLGIEGRFLTDSELEDEVCNSQVHGTISRVSVVTVPTQPIDVIVIAEPSSKFEVSCIKVFESGPTLLPSQSDLCQEKPVLSLCTAPADAAERTWTCQDVSAYNDEPRSSITLGAFNRPKYYYKVTWMPVNMGVACFPRDLTTQFVGTALNPAKSNLGAVIVFIIIAVLVGGLVLFFATYQLRKQLRKFWKREVMAARRLPEEEVADRGQQRGVGSPGSLYGEDMLPARGKQQTVIEGAIITAHPLPKKWYERYNYREEADEGSASAPRPVSQPAFLPESIDVTATEMVPSRTPIRDMYDEHDAAQFADDDDGAEGLVRMCADCRLRIDGRAPQFCQMTGLRHY